MMPQDLSMTQASLLAVLTEQNPWWSTGTVPGQLQREYRRMELGDIKALLKDDKTLVITGPRRGGKTTAMYQLIQDLISDDGVDPRRILFVSFDNPGLVPYMGRPFLDILNSYLEGVLKEPLSGLRDRTYLFLDEVYALPGWARLLKGHFDLRTAMKVVVSGSSSPRLHADAADALVGRAVMYHLPEMRFADVAMFEHRENAKERAMIERVATKRLRPGFERAVADGDPREFHRACEQAASDLAHLEARMQVMLLDYLTKDGYPENLGSRDYLECARSVVSAIDLAIYKDIVRSFKDRQPDLTASMLTLLAQSSGEPVESASLGTALGMNVRTVERYVAHLKEVYLVHESLRFSGSAYKSHAKARKLYVANVGVRNALLGLLNERLAANPRELGRCAEAVALDHVRSLMERNRPALSTRTYYWKGRGDKEVDIVAEVDGRVVPFEVKFRESIRPEDVKGLKAFLEEHGGTRFGVLVTRRTLAVKGDIVMVPLWLFLLV